MRARRTVAAAMVIGAGAVAGLSCTLVSDLDVKQCTRDADCGNYGPQYEGYACSDEICVKFQCTDDASCRARGGNYANTICESQECVPGECTSDAQCEEAGPTAACTFGRCVDEAWGCLFDGSTLPEANPTVKWEAPVLGFFSRELPDNTRAFVCRRADTLCMDPYSGPHVPRSDGVVSITIDKVPKSGFDGYVRIEADGHLPLEFQFAKPLRKDFIADETSAMIMLPPGTVDLFGTQVMRDFDEANSALMTLRLFDCQDRPARDLRLTAEPSATELFFSADQTFVAMIDAQATDENGIGGLAKIAPGIQTISVIHNPTGTELFNFGVGTRAATLVLGFLHATDIRR
jgi:hypothetical protein